MEPDLLDLYERASTWMAANVTNAAGKLDARTPCDQWDVKTLLNHVLDTQNYFLASARGEDASPPGPNPPDGLIGQDPAATFAKVHKDMLSTYGNPGVIEKTGPSLGIAFADQLIHGWDLAKATGQDATMPDGLAAAAYELIHGRFSDEQRKGMFKPEVKVPDDASPQDKLLAYTGRKPS
jgi:uncharacterized protein (TIGR03086 family)